MTVTGVTVSLKVNDTEYGRGSERFVSLKAETAQGEMGFDLQDFDLILEQTLTVNLQAWEAVQSSRFVGGLLKADELKSALDVGRRRTDRVLKYLKQRGPDAINPEPTEG